MRYSLKYSGTREKKQRKVVWGSVSDAERARSREKKQRKRVRMSVSDAERASAREKKQRKVVRMSVSDAERARTSIYGKSCVTVLCRQ